MIIKIYFNIIRRSIELNLIFGNSPNIEKYLRFCISSNRKVQLKRWPWHYGSLSIKGNQKSYQTWEIAEFQPDEFHNFRLKLSVLY